MRETPAHVRPSESPIIIVMWAALCLITLSATALRFFQLEQAPPGFYVDEAAVSSHVLCLRDSGRTVDGARWPLLTPILDGGYSSLAWQVPAAAWSAMFGDSVAVMRGFAALCGALTICGIYCLALWATRNVRIAILSATAMAISPWAFQFSRMAWDPAIAPLYLTWGVAFLVLWVREPDSGAKWQQWLFMALAAFLLFLACLSYAPARVQVLLVLAFFAWWKRDLLRHRVSETVTFVILFCALCGSLWWKTLDGEIQGRFEMLSVFGTFYWSQHGVDGMAARAVLGSLLFLQNLLKHFSPNYLLLTGDINLRHSSQVAGEWSWFDAAAIAGWIILLLTTRRKPDGWMIFLAFGYLAGLVPAALTWHGVPHALRSLGALPFLALFVASAAEELRVRLGPRGIGVPVVMTGIAVIFSVHFLRDYFFEYPKRVGFAFDVEKVELIERYAAQGRLQEIGGELDYPPMALRYFERRAGLADCARPMH